MPSTWQNTTTPPVFPMSPRASRDLTDVTSPTVTKRVRILEPGEQHPDAEDEAQQPSVVAPQLPTPATRVGEVLETWRI